MCTWRYHEHFKFSKLKVAVILFLPPCLPRTLTAPPLLYSILLLTVSESGSQPLRWFSLPTLSWAIPPNHQFVSNFYLCYVCYLSLSSHSCGSYFRLDYPLLLLGLLNFLLQHLLHCISPPNPPIQTTITRLMSWRYDYDHFTHTLITSQYLPNEAQAPKLRIQGPPKYDNNSIFHHFPSTRILCCSKIWIIIVLDTPGTSSLTCWNVFLCSHLSKSCLIISPYLTVKDWFKWLLFRELFWMSHFPTFISLTFKDI